MQRAQTRTEVHRRVVHGGALQSDVGVQQLVDELLALINLLSTHAPRTVSNRNPDGRRERGGPFAAWRQRLRAPRVRCVQTSRKVFAPRAAAAQSRLQRSARAARTHASVSNGGGNDRSGTRQRSCPARRAARQRAWLLRPAALPSGRACALAVLGQQKDVRVGAPPQP
jgi:hypothetical protein